MIRRGRVHEEHKVRFLVRQCGVSPLVSCGSWMSREHALLLATGECVSCPAWPGQERQGARPASQASACPAASPHARIASPSLGGDALAWLCSLFWLLSLLSRTTFGSPGAAHQSA